MVYCIIPSKSHRWFARNLEIFLHIYLLNKTKLTMFITWTLLFFLIVVLRQSYYCNLLKCILLILSVTWNNKTVCHILLICSLSQACRPKLSFFITTSNATLEICRGRLSMLSSVYYSFMRRCGVLFPIEQRFFTCIFCMTQC